MARALVGNIHGGMGVVAIIACLFFAAISGSGIATAAAIGGVMAAALLRAGYSRGFSAAIVAAASPMGIIIPPSIAFIIYAVLAQVSVADMYKVGFPAGFIVAVFLVIPTILVAKRRNYRARELAIAGGEITLQGLPEEPPPQKQSTGKLIVENLWALGTPIIIVGGVFAGVFTPTESAVVAVVYSIIVGIFVYKEMKWRDLPKIFFDSALSTAAIMVIMSAAALFAWVMVYIRFPQNLLVSVLDTTQSALLILFVINVVVLVAGMFMEAGAIQYILVPIALPIAVALDVDPVHFGIVLVVNLAIGMLTPPFGITLFTTTRVFDSTIQEVTKEVLPFLIALVAALFLITYVPGLVMWIV